VLDSFSYLRVVLSIVVGLGLTTALNALAKIIKYRQSIRVYWVAVLWEVGILLMLLQHWYGTWDFQRARDWNYPRFVLLLLPSLSLYVTSHLAFPEIREGKKYDLEDLYYRNRRFFFGIALTYFVFDGLSSTVLLHQGWLELDNGFRLLGIVIVLFCARTANRTFHAAVALIALASLVAYILLFSSSPLAPYP
jgi:hypothetical protein